MASFFNKAASVLRHGLLIQTMLDELRKVGIEITPYYLVEESLEYFPAELPPVGLADFQMRLLTRNDMMEVAAMPECKFSQSEAEERIEKGLICAGAFSGGKLVGFTWANIDEVDFEPCRFKLKNNEAYLFGAVTARNCRGKNLSPHLRKGICEILTNLGRTKYYSISYTFNKPAIQFKRKLNARFERHFIYLKIWGWRRNLRTSGQPLR